MGQLHCTVQATHYLGACCDAAKDLYQHGMPFAKKAHPYHEVAVAVQYNFTDHGVVGHHHRHRAEERLQVVGQLGATGIAGVHGDGTPSTPFELHLRALKREPPKPGMDGALDVQHLLRHHRQHLQVDAVELVEAGPGAAAGQALEELAHGLRS